MNPQSGDVPLAKHLSKERKKPTNKKKEKKSEPENGMWTGIYKKKKESIAFSVKTACMVFVVVRCPAWTALRGRGGGVLGAGGVIVRCSLADVNSMWRPGSAADWQTVPLQSAANQPVSSTRCYRGHNVQPAAPPVAPRSSSFHACLAASPPPPILSWTLSSCQHAKQSERVYLRRDLDASPDAFWVQKFGVGEGLSSCVGWGWGWGRGGSAKGEAVTVTSPPLGSGWGGSAYTTVLLVPMAFLLRMLMAYSLRLVPFSSFRSGFLPTHNVHRVKTNAVVKRRIRAANLLR